MYEIINDIKSASGQTTEGDRAGQWSINITDDRRALYEFRVAETIVFVEIGAHPQLYE